MYDTDLKLPKIIAWRYTHTLFRHGAHEVLLMTAYVEKNGRVTSVLPDGVTWETRSELENVEVKLSPGTKKLLNDFESWWEDTHTIYCDGSPFEASQVKLFVPRSGLVLYSYFGDRGCMCEDGEDAPSVEVKPRGVFQ